MADDPIISQQARELISDPGNTIFVSAVSFWEIRLKQSLGKLRVPVGLESRIEAESFEHLPLTWIQTHEVALLPWRHRDPFDRMLIAQARVEKLTLLTADERVALYGDDVRLV